MSHQITISGNNKAELVKGLHAHLSFLSGTDATSTATTEASTTRGRGGSKKEKADPTFGEDTQHGEEEETEAAFDDSSDEAEEAESEETEEDEAPSVTTDDVRKACGAYSQKLIKSGMSMADAKSKVREILKKNFKVQLVDQLDEDHYEKAIGVLEMAAKKLK